jgi:hypothetical protein
MLLNCEPPAGTLSMVTFAVSHSSVPARSGDQQQMTKTLAANQQMRLHVAWRR